MANARAPLRPHKVRIFGREYSINFHAFSHLNDSDLGNCNNIYHTINIADGLSPMEEADTVLHEVLHAIAWAMHLEFGCESTEERIVAAFATGIMGVLQDNPRLAEYLAHPRSTGK